MPTKYDSKVRTLEVQNATDHLFTDIEHAANSGVCIDKSKEKFIELLKKHINSTYPKDAQVWLTGGFERKSLFVNVFLNNGDWIEERIVEHDLLKTINALRVSNDWIVKNA